MKLPYDYGSPSISGRTSQGSQNFFFLFWLIFKAIHSPNTMNIKHEILSKTRATDFAKSSSQPSSATSDASRKAQYMGDSNQTGKGKVGGICSLFCCSITFSKFSTEIIYIFAQALYTFLSPVLNCKISQYGGFSAVLIFLPFSF